MLLRQRRGPSSSRSQAVRSNESLAEGSEGWVRCATCAARLAHQSWMLGEGGRAPLVFKNPHGIVFYLLLVARVVGAHFEGPPTSEFTWFRGYAWRVGYCSQCQTHVGWHFSATQTDVALHHFVALSRAAVRFERGD